MMSAETETRDAQVPYGGPPLPGVLDDLVMPDVLALEDDERVWVPQAPDVWFRPLLFSVSSGYFVNILRVRRSGILSRHRHAGPVHAVTLRGRWHYLEHDWWAEEGGYSFEPPGDIHTLEVPSSVQEMATLFHVTGAYIYVDPDGNPTGVEDVFSKLENAKRHYERVGLGSAYAEKFVRLYTPAKPCPKRGLLAEGYCGADQRGQETAPLGCRARHSRGRRRAPA
jgi:2,4'-dihydroxyacetophenone dioxygenase